AVGGVRALPAHVIEYLQANKQKHGYLLFVDEVQTGMYRTGPFLLSQKSGITPDILTIGKGTSDMMFPFALTLYADAVQEQLASSCPELPVAIRERHSFELGYKTVLNALDQISRSDLRANVKKTSTLFHDLLTEELASCPVVRDVRCHGLLLAIELATSGWARRWLRKNLAGLYLLAMLRDRSFPVFVGLCQYEPNVLKLTPPLTITPEEVRQVCGTIKRALRKPPAQLLISAAGSFVRGQWNRRLNNKTQEQSHEPVAC